MTKPARILDPIAAHLVETTASAGATYRKTGWAASVRFAVASRALQLQLHLRTLELRRRARGLPR